MLNAMLQGDVKEVGPGKVVVEDIDANTLELRFGYIYTGQFKLEKEADIRTLIYAVDKYAMPGLKAIAASDDIEMEEGLIADMMIIADLFQSKELEAVELEGYRADRNLLKDLEFRRKPREFLKLELLSDLLLKLKDFVFEFCFLS